MKTRKKDNNTTKPHQPSDIIDGLVEVLELLTDRADKSQSSERRLQIIEQEIASLLTYLRSTGTVP